MVTLFLTGLPLELDHRASRFRESIDCILQRLGCATCVCARDALDRVTKQIGDVVLMYLSPSQLGCKSPSQIVPDHAAFNRQTKGYSSSVARFFETASKRARAHSCLFVVKDISGSAAVDYLLQSCARWAIHRNQTVAGEFALR